MRVFLTGATGFIGSALVPELLSHGHSVLGLSRSSDGDRLLKALGADVLRGDLQDLDALRRGAEQADGVVHCGFVHDFSRFAESCAVDQRAVELFGDVLAGSSRPLVTTAGIPGLGGRVTSEADGVPADHPTPRVSEQATLVLAARGVRASVVRLPQVHDRDRAGLVSHLIAIAKEKRVSAYVGDGQNRWSAVHRLDVAPLYRLALEKGAAGARYHAIAEEGVPVRDIAQAIGRGLGVPTVSIAPAEAAAHFGAIGFFSTLSNPATNAITRQALGWAPAARPGIVDDVENSTMYAT